jgi:hypothetical protein
MNSRTPKKVFQKGLEKRKGIKTKKAAKIAAQTQHSTGKFPS